MSAGQFEDEVTHHLGGKAYDNKLSLKESRWLRR